MTTESGVVLNGRTYNHQEIERLERTTARFVVSAITKHLSEIQQVFERDVDKAEDVGEDLTREALDKLGTSRVGQRLYGKGDYKTSRYLFTPDDSIPQALLVDSKAEKDGSTITVEMTQTTLCVKQRRSSKVYEVEPQVPVIIDGQTDGQLLTTTVFVKFSYRDLEEGEGETESVDEVTTTHRVRVLDEVVVITLPSGVLQSVYNPTPQADGIWKAGRNSESRGERFRVRVNLVNLASHPGADPNLDGVQWRVHRMPLTEKGKKQAERFTKSVNELVDARVAAAAATPATARSEEDLRSLLSEEFSLEEQETLWLLLSENVE